MLFTSKTILSEYFGKTDNLIIPGFCTMITKYVFTNNPEIRRNTAVQEPNISSNFFRNLGSHEAVKKGELSISFRD